MAITFEPAEFPTGTSRSQYIDAAEAVKLAPIRIPLTDGLNRERVRQGFRNCGVIIRTAIKDGFIYIEMKEKRP